MASFKHEKELTKIRGYPGRLVVEHKGSIGQNIEQASHWVQGMSDPSFLVASLRVVQIALVLVAPGAVMSVADIAAPVAASAVMVIASVAIPSVMVATTAVVQ